MPVVGVVNCCRPEPLLDNDRPSFLLSFSTDYGMDEGKRVRIPRGPAAVTGDDPRIATV